MDVELATPLLAGPTAGTTSCPNAAAPTPSSMTAAMAAIENGNGFFMMTLRRLGGVHHSTAWSRVIPLSAGAQCDPAHTVRRLDGPRVWRETVHLTTARNRGSVRAGHRGLLIARRVGRDYGEAVTTASKNA